MSFRVAFGDAVADSRYDCSVPLQSYNFSFSEVYTIAVFVTDLAVLA